jgi:hypothetical protein
MKNDDHTESIGFESEEQEIRSFSQTIQRKAKAEVP